MFQYLVNGELFQQTWGTPCKNWYVRKTLTLKAKKKRMKIGKNSGHGGTGLSGMQMVGTDGMSGSRRIGKRDGMTGDCNEDIGGGGPLRRSLMVHSIKEHGLSFSLVMGKSCRGSCC